MRRTGWITVLGGCSLAVTALLLNSQPGEEGGGADIGAGVLFLFALAVVGVGAALLLVGVDDDDVKRKK